MGWFDLAAGPCRNGSAAIIAVLPAPPKEGDELFFQQSANSDVAAQLFLPFGLSSLLFQPPTVQADGGMKERERQSGSATKSKQFKSN